MTATKARANLADPTSVITPYSEEPISVSPFLTELGKKDVVLCETNPLDHLNACTVPPFALPRPSKPPSPTRGVGNSSIHSPPALQGVELAPPTLHGVEPAPSPPREDRQCNQGITTANEKTDRAYYRHGYKLDRLDIYVNAAAKRFKSCGNWGEFVRAIRGRGDLQPHVDSLPHPASTLLGSFQKLGAPAKMTSPVWTPNRIIAARKRGPHQSAKGDVQFLREEYADMVEKQQWVVLPAEMVKGLPGLRLSPLGLVPQRGRRPRTISDYSYFGVNEDTALMAPKEAMQFGRTLPRLLWHIHRANPRFGPVYMSKIDLADGFYRVWLNPEDTPALAVLFPSRPGEPDLIGIPLTLPMGWAESPPYFCAATETVADLANMELQQPTGIASARKTPHRLDVLSECSGGETHAVNPKVPESSNTPLKRPIRYWDIYVDDFCGLVQGNPWVRRAVKRILLTALDRVFRPLDSMDPSCRQEPASIKKMKKGDAKWTTVKTLLGWLVDTVEKTITLPTHRVERLNEILDSIQPKQRTITTKEWHKVIGELRSMSIALPGSAGLFSVLQEAFRHEELDRPRLRLTKTLHGFLQDFKFLANDIAARPTKIAELIPDDVPATLGACDAAKTGMGGVHFVPADAGDIVPLLWRSPFPEWICDRLVSDANPHGDITINDLELTGSIAQHDILAQAADVRERTIHSSYDNTAAVAWQKKGATTTTGPAAYLLRLQSLHQRVHRYIPLRDYIPGTCNAMADALSRRWDLTDTQLLTYFNTHFPQARSWQICHLTKPMYSRLISALSRRRCDLASLKNTVSEKINIGKSGMLSACTMASILSSANPQTQCHTSKSSPITTVPAESHPAKSPLHLAQFRTPCVRSVRRSPAWGPRILD